MRIYKKVLIYLVLIILAAVFLLPIYGVVTLSLKSLKEIPFNYWGIPKEVKWENFSYVWNATSIGLKGYILNSFLIVIPSVVVIIIFALLASYPLSKYRLKGQGWMMGLIIFGITIPHQILIVPVFKMLNAAGLYDTILGLVLIHIGYGLPFSIFLLRNYMTQIPGDLIDQAKVDGCSHMRIIFNILLPLCKPAIAVLAILEFTWIFNEFFYGLVLSKSNAVPVTVALAFFKSSEYSAYWNYQAAASLIISIPTLIVFISFQRFFLKGIMLGSVKG